MGWGGAGSDRGSPPDGSGKPPTATRAALRRATGCGLRAVGCGLRPCVNPKGAAPCPSVCPHRAVRGADQGHAASDLQEKALVVQGRFFQPAEERVGEALRNPEVRHQAGPQAAGRDAGAHGRPGMG